MSGPDHLGPSRESATPDQPAVLLSLLADPDCPRVRVLLGGRNEHVPVREFREFAARRGMLREATELDLDLLIADAGGHKIVATDPWRRLENGLRRIAGLPPKEAQEFWVVPRAVINR